MSETTLDDVLSGLRALDAKINNLDIKMDIRLGHIETRLDGIDAHLEVLTLALADLARMIRDHQHDPETGRSTFRAA